MNPYAGESLTVTVELLEVFTFLKDQGGFQMEGIRAVVIRADNDTA